MTSYEVRKAIGDQKRSDHLFIKWWRKEEDFLDFDLLDRFMVNMRDDEQIDGFDLVDMDEMWGYVQQAAGDKVQRLTKNGVDLVVWSDKDKLVTKEVPFTAESLIDIFDAETDDNFVDS
jgi:hypothetical protein